MSRKTEFQMNLSKCKTECDRTVKLLDNLYELMCESVKRIEERDENWIVNHPKYLLGENCFHNSVHHKLLSINLDLEAFYNSIKDPIKSEANEDDYITYSSSLCASCRCKLIGPLEKDCDNTKHSSSSNSHINVEPRSSLSDYHLECKNNSRGLPRNANRQYEVYNVMNFQPDSLSIETVKQYVNEVKQKAQNLNYSGDHCETEKIKEGLITVNSVIDDLHKEGVKDMEEVLTDNIISSINNMTSKNQELVDISASRVTTSLPNIEISENSQSSSFDISLENVCDLKPYEENSCSSNKTQSIKTKKKSNSSLNTYSKKLNDSCASVFVKPIKVEELDVKPLHSTPSNPNKQHSFREIDKALKNDIKYEPTVQRIQDDILSKSKKIINSKSDSYVILSDKQLSEMCLSQNQSDKNKVLEEPKPPKVGDYCMITHFISPSHFYIQVGDEDAVNFDEMEKKLNLCYNTTTCKTFSTKEQAQQNIVKYCACYIEEYDRYFRAEIVNWLEKEKMNVIVKLVDCGSVETTSVDKLQVLEEFFYNLPKIAQRCHLESLYPVGSTYDNRLSFWPQETTKVVNNMIGDIENTVFQIYIIKMEESRHSIGLDLVKLDNEETSLGQYLIDMGHAVELLEKDPVEKDPDFVCKDAFMKEQIKAAQGLSGITSDMSNDEMLDVYFKNDKVEEHSNVNEAVMGYDPKDEARTCPFQNRDGTCFKGKRCKLRHTLLPADGFTADKEPVYIRAFNDIEMPIPNSTITVRITSVVDIQRFYVQLIRNTDVEATQQFTLNSLIKHMNDHDVIKSYKMFKDPPSLCEIVIAKHRWDGNWYRAKVCEILQNDKGMCSLQVFVVDFGEVLHVDLKDVRKILPEFLDLPFQAVEAHFYNIKHRESEDVNTEKKYFEERYLFQNVMARIIESIGHLEVLLFDDRGQDIGSKLVEAGCGDFKNENIIPHRKNRLLID